MSRKRQTSLLDIFNKRQKSTVHDQAEGMLISII